MRPTKMRSVIPAAFLLISSSTWFRLCQSDICSKDRRRTAPNHGGPNCDVELVKTEAKKIVAERPLEYCMAHETERKRDRRCHK